MALQVDVGTVSLQRETTSKPFSTYGVACAALLRKKMQRALTSSMLEALPRRGKKM